VRETENKSYATVDLQRLERTGIAEIIFGEGKDALTIAGVISQLVQAGQPAIATRISKEKAEIICSKVDGVEYLESSRILHRPVGEWTELGRGEILVICAGTSDLPVANEAADICMLLGNRVKRITDVGVAGLHRLLKHEKALREAHVLIVVAGMEGALPSVVAGLTDKPVIAVPTSIGYGAAFDGLAALLSMINSCASGVSVVNIDNGFGAAYQAAQINRLP
jgi:pyridinium-3,5-biscarboxylic acid mononucleotide synthase